MKKNILLSLLSFIFVLATLNSTAQAPSILWQKSLGGSANDYARSIKQTNDGGYIVAGSSQSNDGNVTGNHGQDDCWLVKLDNTGSTQWQKSFGGTGYDRADYIEQTNDGGYIFVGVSASNDGDVTGHHGTNNNDCWVVKLDDTGNIQWQKSFGGTDDEWAVSILQTSDGGYIVAGFTFSIDGDVTGNHGSKDYWVVKLSNTGNIQWEKSLGGTGEDSAYSIQQTNDGGYIVSGRSASVDGNVTGNHGSLDSWLVKLDNIGNIQWQKSLGGTNDDIALSIHQTNEGGYIVSGYSNSNNGDVTGNHGGGDYWVVKLDNVGNIQWQKSMGGTGFEWATSIYQTSDGGYITVGYSFSNNGDVTGNHGDSDYWVVKLDNIGNIQWQKSLGGTGSESPAYASNNTSILQTNDGGYIIAGSSTSNDGNVTGHHGTSTTMDFWVVKLNGSANPCAISLSISKTDATCNGCNDGTATVNPSGGATPYTFLWSNGQTTQTSTGLVAGSHSVTVTDNAGCTSSGNITINQYSALSTITVTAQVIPPWQREGDVFQGSITASTQNPSGASWHLEIDVLDLNGTYQSAIIYPSTTSSIQNFYSSDPQLNIASIEGNQFVYYAVLDANNDTAMASGSTKIIHKKWTNENVVYYNDGTDNDKISIPTKYDQTLPATKIEISRIGATSFCLTCSSSSMWSLSSPFIITTIDVDGYCRIMNSNSNIGILPPGEFEYKIYSGISVIETGKFGIVKIGSINSYNTNKVLVFIGGWNSNIEEDIKNITNTGDNSNDSWSIAKYPDWSTLGFNTWYIAQPNTNYTQRNAYYIGLALEKIKSIASSYQELDVICHSKGGLEMRTLISGYAVSYLDFPNSVGSYGNYVTPSVKFSNFQTNNVNLKLNKIVFLATPHSGAIYGSLGVLSSPAVNELTLASGYKIIDKINNDGEIPVGINIANVTVYKSYISTNIFYNYENYLNNFNDGLVPGWSSDQLALMNNGNFVPITQIYQDDPHILAHSYIHRNKCLTTVALNHASLNCIAFPLSNNLKKIIAFINGTPSFSSCQRPSMNSFSSQTFGSILSGATIYRKLAGDTVFYQLGITGENGEFNGTIIPALQVGDSLREEASGYETLVFAVDSNIISTGKIIASMIKTLTPTSKIQYPALKLVNQNPITDQSAIDISATAQNIISFEINSPLNQDSIFVPITLNNNVFTTQLDTGYNLILVRFISNQDTVTLVKGVFYFPNTLMNAYTYNVIVIADSVSIGTKVYSNNQFVREIDSINTTIPLLMGQNSLKFIKFGYSDSLFIVDSATTINLSLQLVPYSYSSPFDSSIVNFPAQGKLQYRKNVTVMDTAMKSIISIKQYDDNFNDLSLIPKSRKFEFRHLNTPYWSNIKLATVLDQTENLSIDSIFLMNIKDDSLFTKISFDSTSVTSFDSVVQKITYDYINFGNGASTIEAIVIMKKQAPIVINAPSLNINQNDSLFIPLSQLFGDPDSIKNDMTYFVNTDQNNLSLSISGNNLMIKPNLCWSGNTTFVMNATHDGLQKSNTISITVVPLYAPTITQNVTTLACSIVGMNSYEWFLNGSPLTTCISDTCTCGQDGVYMITITDAKGCTANSPNFNATNCSAVGINETNKPSNIDLYPNPTTGLFILSFNGIQDEPIQITVLNVLGEKVYKEEIKNVGSKFSKQINLSNNPTGVYFIQVQMENEIFNRKLIVSY